MKIELSKLRFIISALSLFFAYFKYKKQKDEDRNKILPFIEYAGCKHVQETDVLILTIKCVGNGDIYKLKLDTPDLVSRNFYVDVFKLGIKHEVIMHNKKNGTPIIFHYEDKMGTKYLTKTTFLNGATDGHFIQEKRGFPILKNLF